MPIIGITGTNCVGKTTFAKDFVKKWPKYNFLDFVDHKINLTKDGYNKDQMEDLFFNILVDTLKQSKENNSNIIMDCCTLDSVIDLIYNKEKTPKLISDNFVNKVVYKFRDTVKYYDLIFYIPLMDKYPIIMTEEHRKKVDIEKRKEYNNLYEYVIATYRKNEGTFFPKEDVPGVVDILGRQHERIAIAELYLSDLGDFKEPEPLG